MRAREFLKELKLDIPDQMVSVQIPLSAIRPDGSIDTGDVVDNPGKRIGSEGDVKWSPPLQQHLDVAKDSVGASDQAVSIDPSADDPSAAQHSPHGGLSNDPREPMLTPVNTVQSPAAAQTIPQQPARRVSTLSRTPGVLG